MPPCCPLLLGLGTTRWRWWSWWILQPWLEDAGWQVRHILCERLTSIPQPAIPCRHLQILFPSFMKGPWQCPTRLLNSSDRPCQLRPGCLSMCLWRPRCCRQLTIRIWTLCILGGIFWSLSGGLVQVLDLFAHDTDTDTKGVGNESSKTESESKRGLQHETTRKNDALQDRKKPWTMPL